MAGQQVRRLFAVTMALAAALGFVVQPLVAKWVLPRFGGTPAVWTTVALFFQATLLAGYGLAHLVGSRMGLRWAIAAQLGLLVAGAVFLPLGLAEPAAQMPLDPATAALSLLGTLGVAVALPAVAVLATAPMLQRWFSGLDRDPYTLYVASNLGSMLGLFAYPFALEPWLDLVDQAHVWTAGYALLMVATLACGWTARGGEPPLRDSGPGPSWKTGLRWLGWSAMPAANLLVVTAHVTTDLAPVPLLWVVPMAIYLATWALAFSRLGAAATDVALRVAPLAAAGMAPLMLLSSTTPVAGVTAGHLGWLAISSLALHGALAADRPPARSLTTFYLWLAAGGVVGGIAIAIVAPVVSSRALDYPALTVGILVALPSVASRDGVGAPWRWGALVATGYVALLLVATAPPGRGVVPPVAPFALLVLLLLPAMRRPRVGGLVVAAVVVVATWTLETRRPDVATRRSFFASYRVVEDGPQQLRWLAHGRTIHGAQSGRTDLRGQCLPYHHPRSPAAAVFAGGGAEDRIAVVGLGIGCMASLRPPRGRVEFIEVDPLVTELAREHFDALARCGSRCEVTHGDGRRVLSRRGAAYDLIVLDAFGSDAVPVHLLTREAMAVYLERLAPSGRLAFHVTNRHVDLEGVLAAAAAEQGLDGVVATYEPGLDDASDPEVVDHYYAATRWLVFAREGVIVQGAEGPGLRWRPLGEAASRPWTDRRAALWDVL